MTRDGAYQTLTVYTQSQGLIKHHLAVEAAMRALALYFTKKTGKLIDVEKWRITGLLHDADYEITRKTPEKHTLYLEEKLGEEIPKDVMYAIKAHYYSVTKVQPTTLMDWALYTSDEMTGLILACKESVSEKKLINVTADYVIKKMEDASFAKSVNREQIRLCEKALGIPLFEFVNIVLTAMQAIDTSLDV